MDNLYNAFDSLKLQNEFENIRSGSYLSKYGYVIKKSLLSSDEIVNIKTELRAKPLQDEKYVFGQDSSFPVYLETENKFYLPKFYGINKYGYPDKEMNNYNGISWEHKIEFTGKLYDNQIEPAEKLIKACKHNGGGILSLGTGGGKSITTLYVLSKLKGKTLIIVNKIPLMKQWINEISQFLPDARVGVIQGQKNIDINDKDIIIAMLQSLSRIDYPDEIFHDIRITVVDEIHNTSSKMFSKIYRKLCSKWSIGLSATPHRADGCEYVFKWHIGEIVYKSSLTRNGNPPIIRMIKINSNDYKEISCVNKITGQNQIQFTSMLSELIEMPKRNLLIQNIIKDLIKEDDNRKILVLSDRRSHLQTIKEIFDKDTSVSFTYGLFLGSMKIKDLEKSKACNVILATYAAFGEGVSEKDLDTLVLITPKKFIGHIQNKLIKNESGRLEQIVGRIFRRQHTERNPIIIDLQDNFSVYKSQSAGRRKFYKEHFKNGIFEDQVVDIDKENIVINNKKEKDKETLSITQFCIIDE